MTTLRPECTLTLNRQFYLDGIAAYLAIYQAVAKRRTLIRGQLVELKTGKHCAMGCFWADNPKSVLPNFIIDEISFVNDSLSARAMPKTRWRLVMRYLSRKLEAYGIWVRV